MGRTSDWTYSVKGVVGSQGVDTLFTEPTQEPETVWNKETWIYFKWSVLTHSVNSYKIQKTDPRNVEF